jgi:hypothetical protein
VFNPKGDFPVTYVDDSQLPEISEETFLETLSKSRPFTVVILKKGPLLASPESSGTPEVRSTIKLHGKRNMSLRQMGLMPIVCPIRDGSDIAGIGVFDAEPADVERMYAADPAVQAGLLTFEIHASVSFPGSTLK